MTDTPMRFVVRQLDPECFVVDDTTTALSYDMRTTRRAAQKAADRRNEASIERADTPMTPDRLAEYRALVARTTDAGALVASPGVLRELLAEVDRLREELSDATAELAENARAMNALRRHRDTAESRLAATERLAEEARDKDNHSVDTDLLLDALGLES